MKRAVILGYQGFGNVGDEAILTGIEHVLEPLPIRVDSVVGGTAPITAFPLARRIVTRRLRPNVAGLRALMRADLLLFSGGGLIHDHWRTVIPLYLAWSVLGRLAGAQVAWLGVGIGPLGSGLARFLAGRMLRLAALVTVRDTASASLARRVARDVPVSIVPDPALFNRPPPARPRRGVGVIVRPPTPRNARHASDFAGALGREVESIALSGRHVVLITLGGTADAPFASAVRTAAPTARANLEIEELGPDPFRALERLASLEALITVRLHGLILGALAATPTLPIAYDDKVTQLAEQLGMGDLCVPFEEATSASTGTLTRLLAVAETSLRQQTVAERVRTLQERGEELRAALDQVARRGD